MELREIKVVSSSSLLFSSSIEPGKEDRDREKKSEKKYIPAPFIFEVMVIFFVIKKTNLSIWCP